MPFVFAFVFFVVVFATIAALLYSSGKSLKECNPLVEKNRIKSNQSARERALAAFPETSFPEKAAAVTHTRARTQNFLRRTLSLSLSSGARFPLLTASQRVSHLERCFLEWRGEKNE